LLDTTETDTDTDTDTDFDGVFDTEYQCHNERFSLRKTDTNRDGEIDYIVEFGKNGLYFNTTIFNPRTTRIKKLQNYKMSKLVSAELDKNDDGKLDLHVIYDFADEEISRKPIANN